MASPEQLAVFGGRNVLGLRVFMDIPERPADVATRHHNKMVKAAMRETLEYHHARHIPLHYKGDRSHERYGYMPRSPKYEAIKQRKYHHKYPLVYTGATSKQHQKPGGYKALKIGGAAEGGKRPISGTLEYAFSFAERIREHFKQKFAAAGGGKDRSEAHRLRTLERTERFKRLRADARRRGVTIGQMRKELETMTQEEVTKLAEVFLASYTRQYDEFDSRRKRKRRPTR